MATYTDQQQRELDQKSGEEMDRAGRKPRPTSTLFRNLTPEQQRQFRVWARMNYRPFDPIQGIWHPVVQDECVKMNAEAVLPEPLRTIAEESDDAQE